MLCVRPSGARYHVKFALPAGFLFSPRLPNYMDEEDSDDVSKVSPDGHTTAFTLDQPRRLFEHLHAGLVPSMQHHVCVTMDQNN